MFNKLKIAFCPAGDENTASSRLRCYNLARELDKLGCETIIGINSNKLVDILYIQKTVSSEILSYANDIKSHGGKVIFDLDDWGDAVPWINQRRDAFNLLLSLCSVVTVDTIERQTFILSDPTFSQIKEVWVIPDPIDYTNQPIDEVKKSSHKNISNSSKLKGCWFGNALNLNSSMPYIEALFKSEKLELFTIFTNEQYVDEIKQKYDFLSVEAWNLKTFPKKLQQHDFCLLCHDKTIEGSQKSSNKMIAALTQGIIPIVSDTPAYSREAFKIGFSDLIVKNPQDAVNKLNGIFIKEQYDKLETLNISEIFRDYFPQNIAKFFLGKIEIFLSAEKNMTNNSAIKINLGCGNLLLPGYINVDVVNDRAGVRPDINCDIRNLSIFPDNYCDEILAVHVIEHFYYWEVTDLLKEWIRILKPKGKLILETPNLITACQEFLKDPEQGSFPDSRGQKTMWCFYGDPNWTDPLMCHRWLYTPQSLANVMAAVGLGALEQTIPKFKLGHPRDMRIEGTLLI